MSFLYVLTIVIYAVISPSIGVWVDEFESKAKNYDSDAKKAKAASNTALYNQYTAQAAGWRKEANDQYFYWIAGVFFSLISVGIFANTFTPKGSWAWNPTLDDEEDVTAVAQSEGDADCGCQPEAHAKGEVEVSGVVTVA
jgi:hypothetical protein